MANMYNKIAESNTQYLLASPLGAIAIGVHLKPEQGVVERGTIMYRNASGMFEKAAPAQIVSTNYLVVLNETVDTADSATIAAAAPAYIAGVFFRNAVKLASGTLSAANELVLRTQGITFDVMVGDATVNNVVG